MREINLSREDDICTMPSEEIPETHVETTVLGGEVVYQAAA